MTVMTTLKAEVKNGHLVLDEPTDLPEGSVVSLEVVQDEDPYAHLDDDDELDDDELDELHAVLEHSIAQARAGQGRSAEEVIAEQRRRR